jgi:hypothetical protein
MLRLATLAVAVLLSIIALQLPSFAPAQGDANSGFEKRVFAKSSGRFLGWKLEKAVYRLGILHYGWAWNLASLMDGASSEAEPATVGCVCVPWFSTGANSTRNFR